MVDRERDPAALSRTQASAFSLSRRAYIRFARDVHKRGVNPDGIGRRAAAIDEYRDGRWYVLPVAYVPTGVALGCPLPRSDTARLWRLTCTVSTPAVALVPRDAYHITVVNRAHYEETAPASLTADEHLAVSETIQRMHLQRVVVIATGFSVTPGGHLLVECLPIGDELLTLRRDLIAAVPALGVHAPRTAQIKVAHLRTALHGDALTALLARLKAMSAYAASTLTFTDVFTPRGRIPLQGSR